MGFTIGFLEILNRNLVTLTRNVFPEFFTLKIILNVSLPS